MLHDAVVLYRRAITFTYIVSTNITFRYIVSTNHTESRVRVPTVRWERSIRNEGVGDPEATAMMITVRRCRLTSG